MSPAPDTRCGALGALRTTASRAGTRALLALSVALALAPPTATTVAAQGVSPASRLTGADESSEYWDLSAVFDSGYELFVRFTVTNEGPGDETAYAIGQVAFPDGRVSQFENGRRKGRWEMSEDGLRVDIGSSLLDLHDPVRRIEVDKNRDGQKIYLRFDGAPGNGRTWRTSPDGYRLDLLDAGTPIAGTLWIRDAHDAPVEVAGRLFATHTSVGKSEAGLTRRRVELHAARDGEAVYLVDLLSPKGESARWLVVERAGKPVFETDAFELDYVGEHVGEHVGDAAGAGGSASTRGRPVPQKLVVRGANVRGTIALGALRVRHEPLEIAPFPFRWLLSGTMDPVHAWLDATVELTFEPSGGDAQRVETTGVVSVFYVNPMP